MSQQELSLEKSCTQLVCEVCVGGGGGSQEDAVVWGCFDHWRQLDRLGSRSNTEVEGGGQGVNVVRMEAHKLDSWGSWLWMFLNVYEGMKTLVRKQRRLGWGWGGGAGRGEVKDREGS